MLRVLLVLITRKSSTIFHCLKNLIAEQVRLEIEICGEVCELREVVLCFTLEIICTTHSKNHPPTINEADLGPELILYFGFLHLPLEFISLQTFVLPPPGCDSFECESSHALFILKNSAIASYRPVKPNQAQKRMK